MKLINTDGMAFIGPGSEWFWTAISGVVLVVTFVAIYRQLRIQAAATAIEQLDQFVTEGAGESNNRAAVEILEWLRDGNDPAYIPTRAARALGDVWEKFALLTRVGHRDPKLLWRWESDAAQGWWLMLGPRIRRRRAETGDPSILENLEWLSELMAKMDRQAGKPVVTWESVRGDLNDFIDAHEAKIEEARMARTVLYLPADAVGPRRASARPGSAGRRPSS